MMRRNILAATTGTLALLVAGCNSDTFGREWEPYRLKVTATVDTPEGLRTGFAVSEYTCSAAGRVLGTQGGGTCKGRGEAIAVDLPKNETLFILLTRPEDGQPWGAADTVLNAVGPPSQDGDYTDFMERTVAIISAAEGIYPVAPSTKLPWFVRFKDVRDPKTVEAVDSKDLSKSYGAGYVLRSLTVQVTDAPVTIGIEKRLGWLKPLPYALSGESIKGGGDTLAHNLLKSDFKAGFDK